MSEFRNIGEGNSAVQHLMRLWRDEKTESPAFRSLAEVLSTGLAFEVFRTLPLETVRIKTPMQEADVQYVAKTIALAPIWRAGERMVDGFLNVFPSCPVWHVGVFRDEKTHTPVSYYNKLSGASPDIWQWVVCDPMFATGGSAIHACNELKSIGAKRIIFACLVAAPEGIEAMQKAHPDVDMFGMAVDEKLDSRAYIVGPGVGDAGDRFYNTVRKD